MNNITYISIEGLVKSGKSDFAQKLSKKIKANLIKDKKEKLTEDLVQDLENQKSENVLKLQLNYLLNRYYQQADIQKKSIFKEITISNYAFYRDIIYSSLLLNDNDFQLYQKMYSILKKDFITPDLIIYLQISFTKMLNLIESKGEELEKKLSKNYWRRIFEAYNNFFFNYRESPMLIINMETTDIERDEHITNIINKIQECKKGIHYYEPEEE